MLGNTKWHLFSIRGHAVYMTPAFLIIMALFALGPVQTGSDLLLGLLWIPVLFIGILLHELGHAAMSKYWGWGPSTIMFWGLGGVAINGFQGRRDPKKSIAVSLAGPAVSLALGLGSGAALYAYSGGFMATDMLGEFLRLSMIANMFWAIFNMLPIYPMDGGQALMQGLGIVRKSVRKGTIATAYVSLVTLALLAVGGFMAGQVFMIILFAYFAYLNVRLIQQDGRQQRWV